MDFGMDAWQGAGVKPVLSETCITLSVKHLAGVILNADRLHRPAGRERELRVGDERVRDALFGFTRNATCGGNRLEKR